MLWLGFVLSTALSLYNHYFAFLLLPGEIVLGTWTIAESWRTRRSGRQPPTADLGPVSTATPRRQALLFFLSLLLIAVLYLPWTTTLQSQFPRQLHSVAITLSLAAASSSLRFMHIFLVAFSGGGLPTLAVWLGVFLLGLVTSGAKRALFAILWT